MDARGTKSAAEDRAAVIAALKKAAQVRKLYAGIDWFGDTTDDLFYHSLNDVDKKYEDDGRLRTFVSLRAKPMAVDSMHWQTLASADRDPSSMGGPRKRVRLRENGAFAIFGLNLGFTRHFFEPGEDPGAFAARVVEEFRDDAARFRSESGEPIAFLALIDKMRRERPDLPFWHSLLRLYTLVVIGDTDAAGALAHEGLAAGEGHFAVGNTTIWQMLARDYDAGAGIFAAGYRPQIP